MLFEDDFNGAAGSKPNSSLWNAANRTLKSGTVCDGLTGISLDGNSNLVISARKINSIWHSGELISKISYKGPRHMEVMAKVAAGIGAWSAPLWEWEFPFGGGVENDVCEQLGKESKAFHTTLHAEKGIIQASYSNIAPVILANAFHIYSCDIYSDHANYFLDGKFVRSIKPSSGRLAGNWPFIITPMCALIDLDMGGWGGSVKVNGPVDMLVDYIRIEAL